MKKWLASSKLTPMASANITYSFSCLNSQGKMSLDLKLCCDYGATTMPAALDVDREQVRMLVLNVGVSEASRRTGIDLSTVKQWSARGKWLAHTREKPELPQSMKPVVVTGVTSPADVLQDILSEGVRETKIGFTRYAARMAKQAGDAGLLEEAPLYKAVADIHGKMHPEVAEDHSTHLSFFSVSMARPGDAVEHALDVTPCDPADEPDDF